ncbi:MarR family winged helix-turn-helix transcriptional regulator [Pelagibacterium flavum]|uniref:MarR family winged helix-turn-helix transcriptional regulator n=1 Tax=Pelagibacterium flavum TaxID=2984530 RepID=A0ABY6IN89_9HYPH|nr:MarR family winged helix-turn-helix transcriptional regulator [Pelagibacterium sp. YIM 151497]UYQ72066.1 MarR family winged helix-turn-helix transcriptional regulator [Pelagibacterium sp. YIM 151497]|eukprot:jgi/Tetstr1/452376/TSEL_039412.t1
MSKAEPGDPQAQGVNLGALRQNLPFLTRALRAYIRAENAAFFADFETEQGEIAVISLIGLNPTISQNEVAATLVLKKSAVTKVIKGLEERGLVQREKVEADKRFNALTLTRTGRAKYAQINARMADQHDALLTPFDAQERTELFDLLNRLHQHLVERNRDRTGSAEGISGSATD